MCSHAVASVGGGIVLRRWWHRCVFSGISCLLCAGLAICLALVAVLLDPAPHITWLHTGLATCLASVAVLLGPASCATFYFATVGGTFLGCHRYVFFGIFC